MHKNRLEAFSDGVIAILITIMVLELKVPHGESLSDLQPLLPIFLAYVLSFFYLAIYWNNHHHLLHTVQHVSGPILWANTHLLFWLSLIPFVTAWAGENHFAEIPVAAYGFILFMSGFAYYLLTNTIIRHHGHSSILAEAIGKDRKGKLSVMLYALAIPIALFFPLVALGIYFLVAIIWLIPDARIESKFKKS